MRRTKIICTIGPKTESEDTIKALAENGMNIARLNMSHGTLEWNSEVMKRIKGISKGMIFPLGLMIDTQGPEIRTDLPSITQKDKEAIKLGVKNDADFIAQSFVRRKQDISEMRKLLKGHNLLVKGDRAIVVSDVNPRRNVDTLEIIEVD